MVLSSKKRFIAKWNFLEFIKTVRSSSQEYIVGKHTREITARLDKALDDYRHGISTYLIVTLPFRHGKSEIVSRHLPPYFLGHFPQDEIILGTYNQSLSNQMSKSARSVIKSKEYLEIFGYKLSKEASSVEYWELDTGGKFQAATINSGATGKGAHVLVIDDYLKGRASAESKTIRDTQWDGFAGDLMTRLAPVHIVIILATRWHADDIIGRIQKRNNPNSDVYDPDFPKFETYKYPARDEKGNYLFTERFPKSWYLSQFATLGSYQAAALLQCDPVIKGGNLLKTNGIQFIDEADLPKNIRYFRFWDLASTEKERNSDDPDWTSGALVGIKVVKGMMQIFIKNVAMCQEESPKRNRLILNTTKNDTHKVQIGVESVAGYKDTYTTLKDLLKGKRIVKKITVSGDKVTRASILEAPLEAGNVFMARGHWNAAVIDQLQQFPAGDHDDHVDSISGAVHMAKKYRKQLRSATA
ncbi:phage terminase large subunit [Lentisphaerota bacterium WC36G]|nr:phage terminase large subunit [Lentisphaerae bacterium WC36]